MSKLKKAIERAAAMRNKEMDLLSNGDNVKFNESTLTDRNKNRTPDFKNDSEKEEIKVQYTKTKVKKTSLELLKKNKVFSMIKDNEMTNQMEFLKTRILKKLKEIDGNTILVTSAFHGEGKTFTSINLGISVAQELDRTVAIVDTDLRNPWKYHRDFASDFWGISLEKGLSDYLTGNAELEEIIINPGIEKLIILPGGKPIPNSSELLGSQKMKNLILDLKNRYGKNRIIIIDSPALLTYTDPLSLIDLVDGVLLVVESGKTKADEVKRLLKMLDGAKVIGITLNKSKEKKKQPNRSHNKS